MYSPSKVHIIGDGVVEDGVGDGVTVGVGVVVVVVVVMGVDEIVLVVDGTEKFKDQIMSIYSWSKYIETDLTLQFTIFYTFIFICMWVKWSVRKQRQPKLHLFYSNNIC